MAQTTPQQRSNLARKAAQIRWSADRGSCLDQNDERLLDCSKLINRTSWIKNRFCLRLAQDPAGVWWLITPAGLCLPASPAEISLWLDLQTLKISP